MQKVKSIELTAFSGPLSSVKQAQAIDALESGQVLLFPDLPFELLANETPFLTANAVDPKRKNISYDWRTNQTKGDVYQGANHERLQAMMIRFAESTRALVLNVLPQYREKLDQARTSFRVVQAVARDELSAKKDDRRLHVDAFPSSPMQGRRILRVFSNINPNGEPRVWRVGEPFESIAKRYLPFLKKRASLSRQLMKLTKLTRGYRTNYDELMLQLHDQMKSDSNYQEKGEQQVVELPANSTWMVFTDQVPHAVVSGQFCLEQTFHFEPETMADPARAPLLVLEDLMGCKLT